MTQNLNMFESEDHVKLPRTWGGGMTVIHTGDPNELNFLGADGGNSQADEQKIVLSARHRNSIVKASITLLNQQLDKQQLISELNRYVGESVATLFRSDIDLSLVG